jgi:hypothetical protein
VHAVEFLLGVDHLALLMWMDSTVVALLAAAPPAPPELQLFVQTCE